MAEDTYKVTLIEQIDTGMMIDGHAVYDYLLQNEAGEKRWLEGCMCFDADAFTEEDWELCTAI